MAVFTMDLEHFSDTGCVRATGNEDLEQLDDMLDGLDEYMQLLDQHGIKATLFAMSSTAEAVKDKLKNYLAEGHALALHGKEHVPPMSLDRKEFARQIRSSKARLEQEFGCRIRGYRAPFFSLDNSRMEMLEEMGFDYDASRLVYQGREHKGQIDVDGYECLSDGAHRRGKFYEFSVACQRFMGIPVPLSGGGYVRLGSWGFVLSMLSDYLKKSDYYVFYLHPFELSRHKVPHVPHLKLHEQWYLSVGLHSYRHKIETIIRLLKKFGYEFVTFEEMADYYEKQQQAHE